MSSIPGTAMTTDSGALPLIRNMVAETTCWSASTGNLPCQRYVKVLEGPAATPGDAIDATGRLQADQLPKDPVPRCDSANIRSCDIYTFIFFQARAVLVKSCALVAASSRRSTSASKVWCPCLLYVVSVRKCLRPSLRPPLLPPQSGTPKQSGHQR